MASQAGRRGEGLGCRLLRHQGRRHFADPIGGAEPDPHGINVNAIAPGVVDGEHWDGVDAFFAKYEGKPLAKEKRGRRKRAFRPHGPPSDLTGMAIFLASDEADYIVAQTYQRRWRTMDELMKLFKCA